MERSHNDAERKQVQYYIMSTFLLPIWATSVTNLSHIISVWNRAHFYIVLFNIHMWHSCARPGHYQMRMNARKPVESMYFSRSMIQEFFSLFQCKGKNGLSYAMEGLRKFFTCLQVISRYMCTFSFSQPCLMMSQHAEQISHMYIEHIK